MRKYLTILAVTVAAVGGLACGSGGGDSRGPGLDGEQKSSAKEKTVVFEVGGNASKADVTYGFDSNSSQDNGVGLPWKKESKTSDDFLVVTMLAQNKGSGEITCKITVDGKVVKENRSSGQYAIVSCNGNS